MISFIIGTDQPFSIVESPFFQEMIKFCNPKSEILGRTAVKNRIETMFRTKQDTIIQNLKVVFRVHASYLNVFCIHI